MFFLFALLWVVGFSSSFFFCVYTLRDHTRKTTFSVGGILLLQHTSLFLGRGVRFQHTLDEDDGQKNVEVVMMIFYIPENMMMCMRQN